MTSWESFKELEQVRGGKCVAVQVGAAVEGTTGCGVRGTAGRCGNQ